MKTSRFRHSYRDNASRYHRHVGDLLRQAVFTGAHSVYQEYPVNRVAKHYGYANHHFDWVIPGLQMVFEVAEV